MAAETRRSVLITGAASGIGAATARRFAEAGWLVGLADIDREGAAALATELSGELGADRAIVLELDVRDEAAWARAAETFGQAAGGRLDVLINNAGLLMAGPLAEMPVEKLRAMVEVNLTGAVLGVQACLPLLGATPGARIVNIASIAGLRALPEAAVYSATKFALRGLGQALRDELKPLGVAVSTVYPGFARTPMLAGAGFDAALEARLEAAGFENYSANTIAKAVLKAVLRGRDEAGAGGQGRALRMLAAVCPPLLGLIWRLGQRRAAKVAGSDRSRAGSKNDPAPERESDPNIVSRAEREPAPADRAAPRPRTTGSS